MIYLKNIVKTSFILWLKRIVAILIVAGFIWVALITTKFFTLLDRFLTIKLNFSLLYSVGLFATMYYFWSFLFKFIAKILDFYDNWR